MPDPDPHSDWHVVLQPSSSQRKVVLWHPTLNELTVRPASSLSTVTTRDTSKRRSISSERPRIATSDVQIEPLDSEDERSQPSPLPSPPNFCPLCYSPTPRSNRSNPTPRQRVLPLPSSDPNQNETALRRIPSYFQLLSHANSRANTPTTTRQPRSFGEPDREGHPLDHTQFNEGYFAKFFEEIQVLGRGGQGVVYLVRHLLNGEALGLYACKKIPVGDSTLSLLRILREVHLLETVQHPNIVSYHHAWLETSIPASFSPAVPTLFVLMSFANGGSLFDFVCARGGGNSPTNEETEISLEERKKRFKSRKKGWISGRAVHLLSVEDILKLFGDIVHGLGFLHSRNILHLDLKAENVLLNWEDEALLPTCKLSDFGNATDSSFSIEREGDSGTLAYTAPEAFERDSETGKLTAATRATDIWGLGLILHLLCFFTLPYRHYDDNVRLEEEIRSYRGFSPSDAHALDHGTRHDIPDSLLRLIAKLVNIRPSERPNCDKILQALAEISEEVELAKLREVSLDKSEMVVRSSRVSEQVEDSATTSIASTSSVRTVAVQRPLFSRQYSPPLKESKDVANSSRNRWLARTDLVHIVHSPVIQRQVLAGSAAFAKLALHGSFSPTPHSAPSNLLTQLLLLETIVDVSTADLRLTLFLSSLHAVFVGVSMLLSRSF